jgi:hypothetical protein
MGDYVYREWVSIGVLNKVLIAVFSIIIVFGTLFTVLLVDLSVEDLYGFIVAWGVLAFILFLFWNYRRLEIKINYNQLSINYGIFNKKSIKLKEIVSCQITKASFGRYGGSGVRYGFDGSTAYTTSFGNAVEIVPKKGRNFVFSSKTPDKICEIINTITKA